MLEVNINEEVEQKISTVLSDIQDADKKILAPAIKRGLIAGKNEAARGVTQVYTVDKSGFKKNVKTRNTLEARDGMIIGSVIFSGKPVSLYRFDVSPVMPTYGKKKIRVSVLKSSGPKQLEDAFVAEMKNGRKNIFERKGSWSIEGREGKEGNKTKHNEKLKKLYGPSVPKMIENAHVEKKVEERMNEIISKRIDHEVSHLLKSGG